MGFWFKAGSRDETERLNGVAHFIEHMLFKGTPERTALELSQAIESRGGDMNAFTSEEMTCYYARMGVRHLEILFHVLFDMVQNSTFPADEVERERGVIQEEIRMYEDQPSMVVMDLLNAILWPQHPLGRPLTGTPNTVEKLSRAEMMKFWQEHYRPVDGILTVAGNVELDTVQKLALSAVKRSSQRMVKRRAKRMPPPTRRHRTARVGVSQKSVSQTNLALGFEAFGRSHPGRSALRVLSVILGENMSSRLFQSLRERHGLVYSVQSSIAQFSDTGSLSIQVGLEPSNLEPALKLIAKELRACREKNLPAAEVRRAKDYVVGQLELTLESSINQMLWMGESILGFGRVLDPNEIIDRLMAVEPDEIRDVARMVFTPGRLAVAAVGPEIDEGELRRMIAQLL